MSVLSDAKGRRHIFVKSIAVNVSSSHALLENLQERLKAKKGFSIATLNLDHIIKLSNSREFKAAYMRHSHVTADGNPIVWLSRIAGQKVSLVPGSELIEPIVELAARNNASVALFGSTTASLQIAAQKLVEKYPDVSFPVTHAPEMGFDPMGKQADMFIDTLKASGVSICFVALGAPKQEIFVSYAQEKLPKIGFVSIGAGLDFISGLQVRAPKIVRVFALEWVWRLVRNPRRLGKRYLECIMILPALFLGAVKGRIRLKTTNLLP